MRIPPITLHVTAHLRWRKSICFKEIRVYLLKTVVEAIWSSPTLCLWLTSTVLRPQKTLNSKIQLGACTALCGFECTMKYFESQILDELEAKKEMFLNGNFELQSRTDTYCGWIPEWSKKLLWSKKEFHTSTASEKWFKSWKVGLWTIIFTDWSLEKLWSRYTFHP